VVAAVVQELQPTCKQVVRVLQRGHRGVPQPRRGKTWLAHITMVVVVVVVIQ